jgi:hypothetical protein
MIKHCNEVKYTIQIKSTIQKLIWFEILVIRLYK